MFSTHFVSLTIQGIHAVNDTTLNPAAVTLSRVQK